jgi:hypothetical protein
MKMTIVTLRALATAQLAYTNDQCKRVIANDFSDDDIDYTSTAVETLSTLMHALVSDDFINVDDDALIDVSAIFDEIVSNDSGDGICNEIRALPEYQTMLDASYDND